MPSSVKATNPRGIEIIFEEEPHEYYSLLKLPVGKTIDGVHLREDNVLRDAPEGFVRVGYTSGTRFVHKFVPAFDPDNKIALKKAQERGVSVEQIHFEWKQKSAAACEMGTRVHATAEDFFYNRPMRFQPQSDKEHRLMYAAITAAKEFRSRLKIIGVEQLVGDLDSQLAGSIDLLAYDEKSGEYWILDWKTNEKIERENRFRGAAQMMNFPIAHLYNCNYVHYSLQLSTYEMLLRHAAYIPRNAKVRRGIIHLTEQGPIFHELPDFSIEVRDMLIHILEQPPF